MVNTLKNTIQLNLKNIAGYITSRKLILFSVDDYGNVHISSKKVSCALAGDLFYKEKMQLRLWICTCHNLKNRNDSNN